MFTWENMYSLKILFEARNNLSIDGLEGESGKPFSLVIHKKRSYCCHRYGSTQGQSPLGGCTPQPWVRCVCNSNNLGVQPEGPSRLGCQWLSQNSPTPTQRSPRGAGLNFRPVPDCHLGQEDPVPPPSTPKGSNKSLNQ